MREFKTQDGRKGSSRDGSFIPYIVEELISRSAYQVVFDCKSESFVNSVPKALKERVDWVDSNISRKKSIDFLAPIFEELCIGSDGCAFWYTKDSPDSDDRNNLRMLGEISYSLEKLFLSIEERLQTDIDLLTLSRALAQMRNSIRSPEGRARIAVLQGLIASYRTVESPCLIAVPTASQDIVEHFHRLTNDTHYLELSKNAMQVSIPRQSRGL